MNDVLKVLSTERWILMFKIWQFIKLIKISLEIKGFGVKEGSTDEIQSAE